MVGNGGRWLKWRGVGDHSGLRRIDDKHYQRGQYSSKRIIVRLITSLFAKNAYNPGIVALL